MIEKIFDSLKSIHFETELLEVLGWDEEEKSKVVEELSEYFDNHTENRGVAEVKFDLRLLFSKDVCNVIFKYMDCVTNIIIHRKGDTDYEA